MAGFKARFAKSLDDIVAVLNLNLRDLEKSSLGGTKTILKGSSDSDPESILIPNPVASVENTEHDLLQGLNKGGYLHLIPALHAYVESLQSREDVADGFAMLNASRLVPVERLPIGDILAPHLSAVNPHVQYILGSQKGVAGGVCDLDSMGVIPIERIPVGLLGGLTPKFLWNPATNTPYLANPAPATTRGWFYISSGEGTQLGTDWANGDWCISDGATWLKLDNSDRVSSVFGRLGAITAQAGDYAAHYAPLNTTLANNAGSSTPPTTASDSLVSKLQALRDNVVYILANWLTLGETSATAYRGDRGKTAYDHSQLTESNPHGTTAAQIQFTPSGGVSSTNAQAAIAELDAEKLAASTAETTYATILQVDACFQTRQGLTPTTDLNTATTPGSYRLYSSSAFSATYNQPVGAYNYGQLRVYTGENGQLYQEYTPNRYDGTAASCTYHRIKFDSSSSWQAWDRSLAPSEVAAKQNTLTFDSTPTDGSSNPVTSNGVYDALAGKASKAYYNDDGAGKLVIQSGAASKNVEFRNGAAVFAFSGIEAEPLLYVNTPPSSAANNETANAAWVIARAVPTILTGSATLPASAPIGKQIFVDGHQVPVNTVISAPSGEIIYTAGQPGSETSKSIGTYTGYWFIKTGASRWVVGNI